MITAYLKCKTKGIKYTAGDLKSDDYVNKLIHQDEGFRELTNLRGSPPYFEKCKKDLFVMIRQLVNPTWFCSFSAAETRWSHLNLVPEPTCLLVRTKTRRMASRDVDTFHKCIQYALEKLGKSKSGFEGTEVSKFKSNRRVGSGNEIGHIF